MPLSEQSDLVRTLIGQIKPAMVVAVEETEILVDAVHEDLVHFDGVSLLDRAPVAQCQRRVTDDVDRSPGATTVKVRG